MTEVLVATVLEPTRRYRIDQKKFDEINAAAEEAGRESPFIVQEEGCEGGKTYDQLNAEEKKAADKLRPAKLERAAERADKTTTKAEEE